MDRRIRRVIHARQRQIKLLEEYRQALIHQAVTGQIDVRTGKPYPAYKDSGVPWLGQVPEHWELLTVRRLFRAVTRKDITGDEPKMSMSRHLGLVRSAHLGGRSSVQSSSLSYSVCYPNDLVMNKYQAHAGLFACAVERGLITPNYTVFRPLRRGSTAYYAALFRSACYRSAFEIESYGVGEGMAPLYTNVFYRVPVIVPPLPEQTAIVEYLDAQTAKVGAAIAAARREIELLREYRERLIADVVTGKVDVREVAARLPEEPPEEESEWIDTADMAEGEETDEDSGAEALAE
jgi:type I restriction enzyme S subunit